MKLYMSRYGRCLVVTWILQREYPNMLSQYKFKMTWSLSLSLCLYYTSSSYVLQNDFLF